jgi:single-stranded-DNA-specific exonuclease
MLSAASNPRWTLSRTNQEYLRYISGITGLSLPVAQTLVNRGIKTPEQIADFLNPSVTRLSDPYELQGMEGAVARIFSAIRSRERILVHGDYDCDGITATAIMVETLKRLGADAIYYIPNRTLGYGMGHEGVSRARDAGATLIITVDCGITSFDAVSSARSQGIDVVITDHHEPDVGNGFSETDSGTAHRFILPDATAIINPKIQICSSSLSALSGAGVAFKLAQALLGNSVEKAYGLLDLAALGTAADIVSLVGDNRIIVKEGCNLADSGARAGIRALRQAAGIKANVLKVSTLQFMLIPRINAAGRIADANEVVRLLLTDSDDEALELADWLNGLNVQRQAIGELVYEQAMDMIRASGGDDGVDGAIVAAAEGWHPGVLGIVAARIADIYYRPAFIFSIKDGVAKGSARSIPPFDIHAGLNSCSSLLLGYGGHKQAAGLSLAAHALDSFRQMISRIVLETVSGDDLTPELRLDALLHLSQINSALIAEIASLEPFGHENEEPVFGARGLEVSRARIVGSRHLKMFLKQEGREIDSIGFDLGRLFDQIRNGDIVDAAFLPVMNEWEGGRSAQLNLKALRASTNGI